ncbi:hypothetical protein EMPS_03664 [Entomortierella parvispora]|uniref:DUF7789 domain-containing protein n=1 Tax=Entomortierella parvispora TaxID=205924 RepID=A0A9P3H760_9FUNG|nr:hypothetical protein EMPS_03664 [Entomortierella parvispora]
MPAHTGGYEDSTQPQYQQQQRQQQPYPTFPSAQAQTRQQPTAAGTTGGYDFDFDFDFSVNSDSPSSSRYPDQRSAQEPLQSGGSAGNATYNDPSLDYPRHAYQQQSQQQQQYPAQAEDSLRQNLQHYSINSNNSTYNNNNPGILQLQQHDPNQNRVPRVKKSTNQRQEEKDLPPTYYQDQPNASPSSAEEEVTFGGRIQRLYRFPCSTNGKALLSLIAVEALIVIAMQAVIVGLYFQHLVKEPVPNPDDPTAPLLPPYLDIQNVSRSVPAYLIVFVFAQIFQWVMTWDAVRAQNTIELIGIVAFNLCCLAYSIFEISQIRNALWTSAEKGFFVSTTIAMDFNDTVKPFLIVVVVILALTQILCTWFAYQLFQEFGWKIYKKIGADPNMKKMYRAYQIYLVLIKLDLFFFVGFSIQFIYLTLTKRSEDPEYWITIFVLPATLLILWVAVYAVRHESRKWMWTFLFSMLCGVVYCVFKVVRMYYGPKVPNYDGVQKFLTLFASLCLVTLLLTIVNAVICFRNFGKGLKPHLMRDNRQAQNVTSNNTGRVLEID